MHIDCYQQGYPISLQGWPEEVSFMGRRNVIFRPMIAIFSSAKCPASSILNAYDYAKQIRYGESCLISGFHSPVEREFLDVLLKGTCPIALVLGRRLKGARISSIWKNEIDKGRLLILSPFKEYQRRVTKENALKCNALAAHMAGRALIIHASQGGSLEMQIEEWKKKEIKIEYL